MSLLNTSRVSILARCALLLWSMSSLGQTFTTINAFAGQPLIENFVNSVSMPTTDPFGTYVDAYVYVPKAGGTDICQKISGAFADATTAGVSAVTVDARGFLPLSSALNCSSHSPFPSQATTKGKLLPGAYTIVTDTPWVVPDGMEVVGLGPSALGLNTTLQASPGFSSTKGALVEMGGGTVNQGPSDAKLQGLTVDCNHVTSNTLNNCGYGIMNDAGIDNTWVKDVVIKNAPVGLIVAVSAPTLGGANSGTYRNINVQYGPTCCYNTSYAIGIELVGSDDGTLVRGVEDVTVSGCNLTGATAPLFGVYVFGASTKIVQSNTECFPVGVQVGCSTLGGGTCGAQDTTHNVQLDDIYLRCTTSCGTAASVAIGSLTYNVSATTVTGNANTGGVLTDLLTYNGGASALSGNFLGTFFIGDSTLVQNCTSNCLALFTTSPSTPWLLPNGITQ